MSVHKHAGRELVCTRGMDGSWADKFWLSSVPRRSTRFIFLRHLCVDRTRQRPVMSCENAEENKPVADGARALRPGAPLLDALAVLVPPREAALPADALPLLVRRREAAPADRRRARDDAPGRACQ